MMELNSSKPEHAQTENEVKFVRYAEKGWEHYDEKQANRIKKELHSRLHAKYGPEKQLFYKLSFKLMLAAASVGLLIFVTILSGKQTPLHYASLNLDLPPNQILSTIPLASEKGIFDEEKETALQSSVAYYEKNDFPTAAVYFKAYLKFDNPRQEALLYYGQTLLDTDPSKAISIFDKLIDISDLDQVYTDYSKWFKALALIKIKEEEEALQLLEGIKNSESFCKKDAIKLLAFINKKPKNK